MIILKFRISPYFKSNVHVHACLKAISQNGVGRGYPVAVNGVLCNERGVFGNFLVSAMKNLYIYDVKM